MKILIQIVVLSILSVVSFRGISVPKYAAPTYMNLGNQTVMQNSGAASVTTISGWAFDIVAVTPSFIVSNLNTYGSLSFDVAPIIDPVSGDLTFSLTPFTSGYSTFNVQLEDLSTNPREKSVTSTIRLDVTFVNGAPTFTVNTRDITVDEKSGAVKIANWAMNITPGLNLEESTQKINFVTEIVTQSAFLSFIALPKVDKFGNLTFEATDKANGSATLKIHLEDDGDGTAPNVNKSMEMEILLRINPINNAPMFTTGNNVIIDEHNGEYNENWATVSAGAPDEDINQQLTFVFNRKVIRGNLQFDTPPSIDDTGTLNFIATPHTHGFVVYELTLRDDGVNTPLPNKNTSTVQAISITVNYINDPPTFNHGDDIVIDEGSELYTFNNWVTNISPGLSPDEQDQSLYFTVNFSQVSGSLAFLLPPQIDENGDLSFRVTDYTNGEAVFDIYLTDDGEFDSPHENTSVLKTFSITVLPVNTPPNNIKLNKQKIVEIEPIGTEVGFFTTADLDPEDAHNYSLVEGEGSTGNDSFTIIDNKLITNTPFNWAEQSSYSIRVKSSDGEFSIEKPFEITILKFIEGIKFASAITPNGDGQNDTWEIEDINAFPDVLVNIYDKAGLTVFKSSGGYTAWDGTHNGKPLPMGTYYFIIDLRNGSPIYQGTLTILL